MPLRRRLAALTLSALALGLAPVILPAATAPAQAAASTAIGCGTDLAMLGTGADGAGGRLGSGTAGAWQLSQVLNPDPVARWSGRVIAPNATDELLAYYGQTPTYGPAVVVDANRPAAWRASPHATAQWISANEWGFIGGQYQDTYYRLQVTIDPAVDLDSLAPQVTFNADNSVVQMWVNDVPQDVASPLAPGRNHYSNLGFQWSTTGTGSLATGWQHGVNTITVLQKSGELQTGLLAAFTGTTTCTPPLTSSLALEKTVSDDAVTGAGQDVVYSFAVRNTGTATVTDLAIDETAFGGTGALGVPSCPVTSLAPTESTVCTVAYETTAADVAAGVVRNTAVATGAWSGGTVRSEPSSASFAVDLPAVGGLSLEKTASVEAVTGAGQTIVYAFAVANTGTSTVSSLAIDETGFGGAGQLGPVTCLATTLAPSASTTCTATYVTTDGDVAAGVVRNTAVATGTWGAEESIASEPSTATVAVAAAPSASPSASASPAASAAAPAPTTAAPAAHADGLPRTGASISPWMLLAALALVTTGLVGRRRRSS